MINLIFGLQLWHTDQNVPTLTAIKSLLLTENASIWLDAEEKGLGLVAE